MEPDQTPPTPPNPTAAIEDRIATLTACVDQLQAEHDRDSIAITFLLLACVAFAGVILLEHRQMTNLIKELQP